MDLQTTEMENELVKLLPLQMDDFEKLFAVASDPLIWEQHPNKERYKKDVFEAFFSGAIESKGAFTIVDIKTGEMIGSSRFYEYDEEKESVAIGYTFIARKYWGTLYNRMVKTLMMNYAFKFVDAVIFHIGENNIRSQKAITKLGAVKFGEIPMTYVGDVKQNVNYIYKIAKEDWLERAV